MPEKFSRIAVFCGAKNGAHETYQEAAKALADVFIASNVGLVYGGAGIGLMGVLSSRMIALKGTVIGVIPLMLVDLELTHEKLTDLHIVANMHERKQIMMDLSDAFIMMPGSTGTFDEFFEMLTLGKLGVHHKPCGILNVNHYYDKLLAFLDWTVSEGFALAEHREAILVDDDPLRLVARLLEGLRGQVLT